MKSHYARGITPSATSGEDHFRGLAPRQHSSEETSQRWRAVGDSLFALTGAEIEPQTFRTDSNALNNSANRLIFLTAFLIRCTLSNFFLSNLIAEVIDIKKYNLA